MLVSVAQLLQIARHRPAGGGPGAVLPAHRAECAERIVASGLSARSTFSFSSRTASASSRAGGSIATRQSSCSIWFCTMSRSAPAVS